MPNLSDALASCTEAVTKEWKTQKRQADKQDRVSRAALDRMRRNSRQYEWSIKEAAYHVMEQAYMKASASNTYPANARQIMYAARPLVMRLTGDKCWKDSAYFTQTLLPDYVEQHATTTANWDVVFDARGHLIEPHTDRSTDLGTIEVRRYVKQWQKDFEEKPSVEIDHSCPTTGPDNRYKFALFIEKEGFNQLLGRAEIANRYDIAPLSTKGMSVTAARHLVERLSERGVTTLVLHDFDKTGFEIMHTLCHNTRRYSFRSRPRVIDLGLRLIDVQTMALDSESVEYTSNINPRENLRECGATDEECDFLVQGTLWNGKRYGQRVELNAMDSAQFVTWLEGKLKEVGVSKVVPDEETLAKAYRRIYRSAKVQAAIDRAIEEINNGDDIQLPDGIEEAVRSNITGTARPWDEAVFKMAYDAVSKTP